jgi:hypothetical protein
MVFHQVTPQNQKTMIENADSSEDATAYYATTKVSWSNTFLTNCTNNRLQRPGLTWQTGYGADARIAFIQNGTLANSTDTAFRAVDEFVAPKNVVYLWLILISRWPSLSVAIDLGSVASNNQPDPVFWALGLVRDPLVNYTPGFGSQLPNQLRTGYYWSAYGSVDQVVSDRPTLTWT